MNLDRVDAQTGITVGVAAIAVLLLILLVGGGVDLFLRFFGTLFATLIGVGTAFWLNRRAEKRRAKQLVLNHLRALQQEMDMNEEAAAENQNLIGVLSGRTHGKVPEADYYVLAMFSVDAWDSALQEQLLEVVRPDLFHDFQQLYSQIRSTNELVKRLRRSGSEMAGKNPDDRELALLENIDDVVAYWDADDEEVDIWLLGILIDLRCRDVESAIGDISGSLDGEIDRLEAELNQAE